MMPSQIEARLAQELDAISDDKHALNAQQREQAMAQIMQDKLLIERAECALIFHAEQSQSEIVDFRERTDPKALLGLALVTSTPNQPSGTTGGHAIDLVYGGRR